MTKPVCQCYGDYDGRVIQCPLCAAASDLYAACEAAAVVLSIRAMADPAYAEPAAVCRAALAKARGEDAK